jgi:bifunctional non-homologous end joining protein LigD
LLTITTPTPASGITVRRDTDPQTVPTPAKRRPQKAAVAARSEAISPEHLEQLGSVRLTNPQRVVYPDDGITKFDLAAYFTSIADWILPHIVDRPLSVVRCPDGVNGSHFFQKHPFRGIPDAIRRIRLAGSEKDSPGRGGAPVHPAASTA